MGKISEKREWLETSKDVVEGEDKVQKFTGLEFWFTPRSPHRVKHEAKNNEDTVLAANVPTRYKMVMVTVSILFVLLHTLIPPIRQLTETLPLLLSDLLGATITVFLMTYLIMPSVTVVVRQNFANSINIWDFTLYAWISAWIRKLTTDQPMSEFKQIHIIVLFCRIF
jgi:antibiotic biosynthesis monooxygenase (ABM) superfamily enzyme